MIAFRGSSLTERPRPLNSSSGGLLDAAHAMAEQSIAAIRREGCRCALVDASPLRPGRRRSAGQSNRKGRRRESGRGEERFIALRSEIAGGLRSGSLSPEGARSLIREAGFDEFLRVATS